MSRKGLTLIEVLVALVFIVIVFTAVAYSQIGSLRLTRDAKQASVATQIVSDRLESLAEQVGRDFADYSACPGEDAVVTCSVTGETVAGNGRYVVDYTIASAGSSYDDAGLIQISVTARGPSTASYSHYVSCMEASPSPTVKAPDPCPTSP